MIIVKNEKIGVGTDIGRDGFKNEIVKNEKMGVGKSVCKNEKKVVGANKVIKKQLLFIFLFLFLSLICPMSAFAANGTISSGELENTGVGRLVDQENTIAHIKETIAWMPTDDTRFTKPIGQKQIYDKEAAENGEAQEGSESNSNYQKLKKYSQYI